MKAQIVLGCEECFGQMGGKTARREAIARETERPRQIERQRLRGRDRDAERERCRDRRRDRDAEIATDKTTLRDYVSLRI